MIDRSSYEPLYQQIKKDIEQQILDGTIKIGDKLMSETEMLRHYNVGRMTVRNALAELVATGCLRKEQGLGTFCAALPRREVRKNIDVLLNTADTYFIPYFLSGISRVLDGRNCNLILHDTLDSMDTIAQVLEQTLERGTDGIILQPYTGAQDVTSACREAIAHCQELGVPLITIDGKFKGIDTACIMNNDNLGGYLATSHLIEMGHKNILGLFRDAFRDSAFRSAGYRQAMEEAGLQAVTLDADTTQPEEWIDLIHSQQITAVVCYNDYLAADCYHSFTGAKLRFGQDISIVGYDDTEVSRTSLPRITTITHPKDKMGEQAAAFLLDWVSGNAQPPYHYMYEPRLLVRESVRKL